MKYSIERHKDCYTNRIRSEEDTRVQLEHLNRRYVEIVQANALYKAQIELAEKEGKDGFDRDKYAIKRLCI